MVALSGAGFSTIRFTPSILTTLLFIGRHGDLRVRRRGGGEAQQRQAEHAKRNAQGAKLCHCFLLSGRSCVGRKEVSYTNYPGLTTARLFDMGFTAIDNIIAIP